MQIEKQKSNNLIEEDPNIWKIKSFLSKSKARTAQREVDKDLNSDPTNEEEF
jgi:hypothetical protein